MNCRFCKSNDYNKHFISGHQNVQYSICKACGCHNKSDDKKFNYDDSDKFWNNVKDPDGKVRNINSDKERKFKLKNWYGEVANFINSYNNPKVLDIGCGLGYLLMSLNTKYKFGLEASKYACDSIKEYEQNIKIFNLNSDDLNNVEETFDIIVAYHVIEHVNDPVKFLQNIKSKLNKGGKLIIGTPLIGTFISNFFSKNYRLYNEGHEILFNIRSLKKLHQDNGFKIVNVEKPFFKTDYFTFQNILRLFDNKKISPPFYGSIVTIYSEYI